MVGWLYLFLVETIRSFSGLNVNSSPTWSADLWLHALNDKDFFFCFSHKSPKSKQGKAFSVRFTLLIKYYVFLVHLFTESVAYQGCQINVDATFQASLKLRNSKAYLCNAMTGTLQTTSFLCQLTFF